MLDLDHLDLLKHECSYSSMKNSGSSLASFFKKKKKKAVLTRNQNSKREILITY